jgi:RNA polymerase sigma-70 factor (ECF subfamily)
VRFRLGRTLRAKLDSDDVLQEVYLRAHEAFDRFRWHGDASFTRWLCRIAENAIRGLADHHGARKRTPPPGLARVSRIVHDLTAYGDGPATEAARRERSAALARALDALEDELREVLLLRHFLGQTIDEIAHATGRSPTSTRRLLGRAALALGRRLEEAS